MTKSATPIFLVLLLIGGSVAGIAWWMQKPASPAPVVAVNPPPPMPAPPPPVVPVPPPEAPPPAPPSEAAAQTPAERLASTMDLLNGPAWDAAATQQAQDLVDTTYAPLYDQLGLSAADSAAMSNLLVQRFAADRAALADAASQGLNLTDNPGDVAVLIRTADAPLDNQINALLGPDGYGRYQLYALPIRLAVGAAMRRNQP